MERGGICHAPGRRPSGQPKRMKVCGSMRFRRGLTGRLKNAVELFKAADQRQPGQADREIAASMSRSVVELRHTG
jgi:hypothetical protein